MPEQRNGLTPCGGTGDQFVTQLHKVQSLAQELESMPPRITKDDCSSRRPEQTGALTLDLCSVWTC
jgi:hypothetical protein